MWANMLAAVLPVADPGRHRMAPRRLPRTRSRRRSSAIVGARGGVRPTTSLVRAIIRANGHDSAGRASPSRAIVKGTISLALYAVGVGLAVRGRVVAGLRLLRRRCGDVADPRSALHASARRATSNRSRNGACAGLIAIRAASSAEPRDPVDLRERPRSSRPGRPLHIERVRRGRRGVEIALDGPGGHELPALLTDLRRARSPGLPGAHGPVSSTNSRRATSNGSSPGSISPFRTPQAPASFLAKNGPPGWPSSTSRTSSCFRHKRTPALLRPGAFTGLGSFGIEA